MHYRQVDYDELTSRLTIQLLFPAPEPGSKWYAGGVPSMHTAQTQTQVPFIKYIRVGWSNEPCAIHPSSVPVNMHPGFLL